MEKENGDYYSKGFRVGMKIQVSDVKSRISVQGLGVDGFLNPGAPPGMLGQGKI